MLKGLSKVLWLGFVLLAVVLSSCQNAVSSPPAASPPVEGVGTLAVSEGDELLTLGVEVDERCQVGTDLKVDKVRWFLDGKAQETDDCIRQGEPLEYRIDKSKLTPGEHTVEAELFINLWEETRAQKYPYTFTVERAPALEPVPNDSGGAFVETFEAEAAQVKTAFVTEADADSSAGGYLTQPKSVKNTRKPAEEATLSFQAPKAGTYTAYARLYGPSSSSDAIYVGFDGTLNRKYTTTYGKYQWVKVASQQLKAGSHRVSLGHGEAGARIDMVVVSDQTLSTQTLNSFVKPGAFTQTFEAERARVTASFVTKTDARASQGGYLTQPESIKNSSSPGEEAKFRLEIPTTDTYTMWARLYGPSANADAVYLGFDGKLHRKYVSSYDTYQWVKVTSQVLKAGVHRVSLGHGEAGARVDMLVVSSEALSNRKLDAFVTLPASAPTPAPAPAPEPKPEPEPVRKANYLDILEELEGFGRNTTGGKDGKVVVVTNLKDSGAGSLREAVSQKGPRWIVFKQGLKGTIKLGNALEVTSDKTIDGRGADITLSGQTLELYNDNIIVTHLKFQGSSNDAIRVARATRDVWIHRNSLSKAYDGLIDIIEGSRDITVSWNTFSSHGKTMLLGHDQKASDSVMTVSLHHNVFRGTGERNPKMNRGKVHSYNNYITNWRYVGAYAQAGGQVYSEANIYEAGAQKRASNYKKDQPGYLRSVNDLMQNGAYHNAVHPDRVFKPSSFYSYKVDKADAKLKSTVSAQAGWQSVSFPASLAVLASTNSLASANRP